MTEQEEKREEDRHRKEEKHRKRLERKQESALQEARAAEEKAGEQRRQDVLFMEQALDLARQAAAAGEVPIGCVIVKAGEVISRGYNRRNTDHNVLSHAEMLAIREASERTGDWRLEDCTLYVTLEPCQMCAGAILQARIPRVVMGCMNPKAGCAGSVINLLNMPSFNHQVSVTRGVLEAQCSQVLKDFFRHLRQRRISEEM